MDFPDLLRRASEPAPKPSPACRRHPVMTRSLSVAKRQFSWREPIRPFISSTFRDFQKERDVLVKRVFPKLEQLCRSRGTYFAPVDLRWGITDEQAGSGDVIRLCLDYVAKSQPYFLGLIGERYGSHQPPLPSASCSAVVEHGEDCNCQTSTAAVCVSHGGGAPGAVAVSHGCASGCSHDNHGGGGEGQHWVSRNFKVAARCGYPWLLEDKYRCYSLTALEIELAAYLEKFRHVRFYMKKSLGLFTPDGDGPPVVESRFAVESLRQLKERICESGYPVVQYGSMDELCEAVTQDWRAIIDEVYPPLLPELLPAAATAAAVEDGSTSDVLFGDLFNEWAAHEAFAESRRRAFVSTAALGDVVDKLNQHVQSAEVVEAASSSPTIVVLVGERGSGKSALLANWSKGLDADEPDVHIVSHYVGSSASSTSPAGFLLHCIAELRARFLEFSGNDQEKSEDQEDLGRARAAFGAALALGRAVVILDGIEEMTRESVGGEDLDWLPRDLPPQCRLVLSTSETHSSYKVLAGRSDVHFIKMPLLVQKESRQKLVRCHLAVHCKQLSEDQLDQVVSSPLADKPFFLASLANEMRIFGEHEKVSERLSYYLAAESASHLWMLVIQRWVNDYGQDRPLQSDAEVADSGPVKTQGVDSGDDGSEMRSWVATSLRLLAVSRHGLSDSEVLSALKLQGFSHLTSFDWASFRSAAGDALFEQQGGLLCFFHQHLRAAIYECLLGVKNAESRDAADLQAHNPWLTGKARWHKVLGDYFERLPPSLRRTEELPWQRSMSSDVQGLARAVCEPAIFLDCVDAQRKRGRLRLDLLAYWRVLERAGYGQVTAYRAMLDNERAALATFPSESIPSSARNYFAMLASSAGRFLASRSKFVESQEMLLEALDHANILYEQQFSKDSVSAGDNTSSGLYRGVQLLSAMELLSSVQEQLADMNLYQLNTRDAESWYRSALLTTGMSVSLPLEDVADDLHAPDAKLVLRRGRLLDSLGYLKVKDAGPNSASHQRSALSLLEKARQYMEVAGNTPGQADVLFHIAVSYSRQGNSRKAEDGMRAALRARKAWYGSEHPAVAEILNELAGSIARRSKNRECYMEAEDLFRQALSIRRQTVGPDHILTATTLFHLSKLLRYGNDAAQRDAVGLLRVAVDIRSRLLGTSHVLTCAVRKCLGSLEASLRCEPEKIADAGRGERQRDVGRPGNPTHSGRRRSSEGHTGGWQASRGGHGNYQGQGHADGGADDGVGGGGGGRGRGHGVQWRRPADAGTGEADCDGKPPTRHHHGDNQSHVHRRYRYHRDDAVAGASTSNPRSPEPAEASSPRRDPRSNEGGEEEEEEEEEEEADEWQVVGGKQRARRGRGRGSAASGRGGHYQPRRGNSGGPSRGSEARRTYAS